MLLKSPQHFLALLSQNTNFQHQKGRDFSLPNVLYHQQTMKSQFRTLSLRAWDPNSSLFLCSYTGTGLFIYIFRIRKTVKSLDQLFPWGKKKKIILKALEADNLSMYWRNYFSAARLSDNTPAYKRTLNPSSPVSKFSCGYLVTGEDVILKVMV